jgi:hypothetical protein
MSIKHATNKLLLISAVLVLYGCCGSETMVTDKATLSALRTINENPDPLHSDNTPSVDDLVSLGDKALVPELFDLLINGDPVTRLHASRVLSGITAARFGYIRGKGWPNAQAEARWRQEWDACGYDDKADEQARRNSIHLWMNKFGNSKMEKQ